MDVESRRRSIFVTGANGFVGRRLLREFASRPDHKLVCLTRTPHTEAASGLEWVRGDLLRVDSYHAGLERCGVVIHLAAATGRRRAEIYHRENSEATRILVGACLKAGISEFLHVSTIAIHAANPRLYPYAESKKNAEQIVSSSSLQYTIVRPTMILGPDSPVLEALERLATAPVTALFGGGRARVQPVFVDDFARFLADVAEQRWFCRETVEFGGRDVLEMKDLIFRIRTRLSKPQPRSISVPGAAAMALAYLAERCLPSNPPISRGQITAFMSDGTAAPHPFVDQWGGKLKRVDEMLELSLHAKGN